MNLVWGEGPEPCPLMFIGEAPGAVEEREGRPFVGPSGQKLREAIQAVGVDDEEVYITNVYKHRPPGNRNPTDQELDEHLGHLIEELDRVRPDGILLLGRVAAREFFGESFKSVGQTRGEQFGDSSPFKASYPIYMVTWHPSYVLRKRGTTEDQFFQDVELFITRTLGE